MRVPSAFNAYVVRVHRSSLVVETSPSSSTCVTRPDRSSVKVLLTRVVRHPGAVSSAVLVVVLDVFVTREVRVSPLTAYDAVGPKWYGVVSVLLTTVALVPR